MPRKKQGPRRLDEEEQRAGNFVMGGDAENNEERNRELTERLAAAPASQVDTIVQGITGEGGEGSLYTVPVASSQSKMYSVIFDDDDDMIFQFDEDEGRQAAAKDRGSSKKKSKNTMAAAMKKIMRGWRRAATSTWCLRRCILVTISVCGERVRV